jgi:hypothetical protein
MKVSIKKVQEDADNILQRLHEMMHFQKHFKELKCAYCRLHINRSFDCKKISGRMTSVVDVIVFGRGLEFYTNHLEPVVELF